MGLNAMASTASEMRQRRSEGVEIVFPEYGDTIAIRPMDAAFFFRHGRIPDFLAPAVNELLANGNVTLPTPEKNMEWLQFLDELVKFAFVDPKVVDNPQGEHEISIDDVGYSDKVYLYRLFGYPADFLRRFRDGQKKSVATVDASKNNGRAPQPVTAPQPVGE